MGKRREMREELPKGWTRTTLSDICTKPQYGWTCKAAKNGRIKYLRTTDISSGGIDWGKVPYCDKIPSEFEKYSVRRNDILVARAGSVGVSHRVRDVNQNAVFASYLIRFKALDGIPPQFIEFFLKSEEYWRGISEFSAGIAIPNVNATKLASIELPLAPVKEQRRIVAKLEKLLDKVDGCQKRLTKIPIILKRFRQSVLAAACSGRLTADWREQNPDPESAAELVGEMANALEAAGGRKKSNAAPPTEDVHDLSKEELPSGWELAEMRNIVEPDRPVTYGILKPGPDTAGGVPYIRVADFPRDKLNFITIRRTTKEIEAEYARARLRQGDILLSIRGTVGRVCIVPGELQGANITQDSARLTIQQSMDNRYVAWLLRAPSTQKRMQRAIKGVAIRGINIGDVRALQVPIPSLAEQQEIVRRVEGLFTLADEIEARYRKAKASVDKLMQSILAKAFRGELVPQDPSDEPASELLKRIKDERAKREVATRGKTTRKKKSRAEK
jgi:type I restriction enzyme, S subunit